MLKCIITQHISQMNNYLPVAIASFTNAPTILPFGKGLYAGELFLFLHGVSYFCNSVRSVPDLSRILTDYLYHCKSL